VRGRLGRAYRDPVEAGVRGVKRSVLLVLIIFFFVLFGLGGLLWWPPCALPDRSSELGTALIGGGIVALAVLVLERSLTKEANRRDLLLQLGLGRDMRGIDLSGRNLSGFHLPTKDFSHAVFRRASLRGSNLSGAHLDFADLREVDLRGTKLDKTGLAPSKTLVPSNSLAPGAIFPDASCQGWRVEGVMYDSATKWPSNFPSDAADDAGAECIDGFGKLVKWWYRHRIHNRPDKDG
jgi:hypothetical protein